MLSSTKWFCEVENIQFVHKRMHTQNYTYAECKGPPTFMMDFEAYKEPSFYHSSSLRFLESTYSQ